MFSVEKMHSFTLLHSNYVRLCGAVATPAYYRRGHRLFDVAFDLCCMICSGHNGSSLKDGNSNLQQVGRYSQIGSIEGEHIHLIENDAFFLAVEIPLTQN